ncbi:MAG: trypsin-like peptidase domain-containing protein [Planctomycetota bacterium]
MDSSPDLLLGQLAVKNGLISASDLSAATEVQAIQARRGKVRSLGQVLVELGKLTETQLSQLSAGQRYVAARHEGERLGELAIKNGLATLHQVEEALARQKQAFQGGRGPVLKVGEVLVSMRVLSQDDVGRLLQTQQRGRSAPQPAPPRLTPGPRIEEPVRRPRGPAPWIAPVVGVVALAVVASLFLGLRARSKSEERQRAVREMEASMERGRSALSRGEVPDALAAYEKAAAQAREAIASAERAHEDAASARSALGEADAKVDALRASARWIEQIQGAVQTARRTADTGDGESALGAVERAMAVIADYQGSAPNDDPNRPLVSRWLSELRDSKLRLLATNAGAQARAKADALYQAATDAMDRLVAAAGRPTSPTQDPAKDALLLAAREAETACASFESAAEPDDPRRPEIDRWQKRLEDLQGARMAEVPGPGQKSRGPATSAQELVKTAGPSIVHVFVESGKGGPSGWGSGFIVDSRGYVVTNRHVVSDSGAIWVGWDDTTPRARVEAILVAWSTDQDLALLKLPPGEYRALELASEDPALGQKVVAIGFPVVGEMQQHPSLTVNEGIVSSTGRQIEGLRDLLETDAVITPGNSGGPIFALDGGTVLGVAVAAFQGSLHGRNLGIPSSWIRSEFKGLTTTRGYETAIPPPPADEGRDVRADPGAVPKEDPALKGMRDRAKRDLDGFTRTFDQGKIWPSSAGYTGKTLEIGGLTIMTAMDAWKAGLVSIERGSVDLGIELLGVSGSWYRGGGELRDALLVESTYARLKVLRACFAAGSRAEALAAVRTCREKVVSLQKELTDLKHAQADPEKRWSSTPQALKDVEDQLNTTKRLCTDLGVP